MNSRLRIVLIGPMYPYRGGIAHFTERMAQGFLQRGHQVDGITFTRQYPKLLFPGHTQYEAISHQNAVIEAERLIDSINPYSWWKTQKRIQQLTPDVVIFRYWQPFFAPAFGTIARRLSKQKIKTIAVVDNALPHERRIGDIALGRYFFRSIQGNVVLSDSVGEDLDRLKVTGPRSFAPHPIYDSFGKPADPIDSREKLKLHPKAQVILFFGFIRRYKGLHVLLDSLKNVQKKLPNYCLLVAGEFYEDEDLCKTKIKEFGLSDHVRLINQYIPKDQVANLFAAADVVVQPYLSATQSGVAQIAYHFEVPIITTDVGGLAEIIPHQKAGLIIPPNDPDALFNAIIRYFSEEMHDDLVRGVKIQKGQFGWDRFLDAVESLIQQIR